MTAPERGTATIAPDLARRIGSVARALVAAGRRWETDSRGQFRYAVDEALDPESVGIDPLAHL